MITIVVCIVGYLLMVGITSVMFDDIGSALIWPITGPLFLGVILGVWVKKKLS